MPSKKSLGQLGVYKFPYCQVYRNSKCVASFSPLPSLYFNTKVGDELNSCMKKSPAEWRQLEDEKDEEIKENQEAQAQLRQLSKLSP